MPTHRTTLAAVITAATLLGVTAGCTGDDNPAPLITSTPVLTGIPNEQNDPDLTPDEKVRAAAVTAITDYYDARGRIEADPSTPVTALDQYAGGPVYDGYSASIALRRSQGITSTGAIAVVTATPTGSSAPVDADGRPITTPDGAWVTVDTCTDISGWNLAYQDGTSATLPDRGQFERVQLTVRNAAWPDTTGWRVTSQPDPEKVPSC